MALKKSSNLKANVPLNYINLCCSHTSTCKETLRPEAQLKSKALGRIHPLSQGRKTQKEKKGGKDDTKNTKETTTKRRGSKTRTRGKPKQRKKNAQ